MMVGTYANGWLVQLRPECCRDHYMKPLKEDQQPQSTSVVLCCASGVKPKILSTKKKGLDASNDRGLTESSGEVFFLTSSLIG